MNEIRYNVSSSPHVRSPLSTGGVMYDVILALMPATVFGVWRFGAHALRVILMSVVTAALTEFVFDYVTEREDTVRDGSAVVTGLLLALCLPASVPLYVPYIGAVFAILVVKCLFGGLGKNFMNPALGGRIFLLLSFGGTMTRYTLDGVTGATPLAALAGGDAVNVVQMWTGHAGGVIGCSAFALFLGGLYLWVVDGIGWQIPVSTLVSFTVFLALFGGQGLDPGFLLAHLAGGGIVMAAFFMATDPVTSPVTAPGQLLYGTCVGVLSGLFRVFGTAADSVSYAVVLAGLLVPAIDRYVVPPPFAYRADAEEDRSPRPVVKGVIAVCCVAVVGIAVLGAVSGATRGIVEERALAADLGAYQEAMPEAASFQIHDGAKAALDALDGAPYGTDVGEVYLDGAVTALDGSGAEIGWVVTATSAEGMDGPVGVAVGIRADGTISGIAFTELDETPGIGMKADEPEFKDQFAGLPAGRLVLGADIDAVSGATVTSDAVVDAVDAALELYAERIA